MLIKIKPFILFWYLLLLSTIDLWVVKSLVAATMGVESVDPSFTENSTFTTRSQNVLGSAELAIVVNDQDPMSVKIGNYYSSRRKLSKNQIKHIAFAPGNAVMTITEFSRIKQLLDEITAPTIQAYALTWNTPYRVDCMSITTAFAVGFDKDYCADACVKTKVSPYFNSTSRAPYTDFGIRPTIMLAANNYENAKALIDRGIKAHGSFPLGTGYLLDTSDIARNIRAANYDAIVNYLGGAVNLKIIKGDYIKDKTDVLFYFTGVSTVKYLTDNKFLSGSIADHLTSSGGILNGKDQMSSIKWLEAGATGSYGAVVEPCNFPEKFPAPGIVIDRYTIGETLLEAYWKSVKMPGQGVFIGEPLASPFLW